MFDYLYTRCHPFEEKLLYWPPLAKAQLYPVIINSDGVLMPSRVDNYPNACIEAQTLGIPVIGTDNSSLEEMITDGKTGFLAKNGDEDSIYKAVERLLGLTTGQRQVMRQELLDYSHAIASENRVGQLIKFYEETLAGS
jgi:glycosyltransferase involved in cell wall biosynthesis